MSDRILLDTHVWLWMFLDPGRIKGAAHEQLVASAESDERFVAAISMYEVAAGAKRGRIELNMATQAWFDLTLVDPGLRLLALTPAIAAETLCCLTTFMAIRATALWPQPHASMTWCSAPTMVVCSVSASRASIDFSRYRKLCRSRTRRSR